MFCSLFVTLSHLSVSVGIMSVPSVMFWDLVKGLVIDAVVIYLSPLAVQKVTTPLNMVIDYMKMIG